MSDAPLHLYKELEELSLELKRHNLWSSKIEEFESLSNLKGKNIFS